jgi:hypothetical protein
MTDAELDAALAALTAIEVDPQMPVRVLGAIEQPAPRLTLGAAWAACGGVAAVAILVVAVLAWRIDRPSMLPAAAAAPSFVIADALAVPSVPVDVLIPVRVREAVPIRHATTEQPWPYSMPALEREAPLIVDRIRPAPLHSAALGVEPLSIAQLEIRSLDR